MEAAEGRERQVARIQVMRRGRSINGQVLVGQFMIMRRGDAIDSLTSGSVKWEDR